MSELCFLAKISTFIALAEAQSRKEDRQKIPCRQAAVPAACFEIFSENKRLERKIAKAAVHFVFRKNFKTCQTADAVFLHRPMPFLAHGLVLCTLSGFAREKRLSCG